MIFRLVTSDDILPISVLRLCGTRVGSFIIVGMLKRHS